MNRHSRSKHAHVLFLLLLVWGGMLWSGNGASLSSSANRTNQSLVVDSHTANQTLAKRQRRRRQQRQRHVTSTTHSLRIPDSNTKPIKPVTATEQEEQYHSRVHPCACQPSFYRFALNFSRTACQDTNIPETANPSRGISSVECLITPADDNLLHDDLAPWKTIHQIEIHEYGDKPVEHPYHDQDGGVRIVDDNPVKSLVYFFEAVPSPPLQDGASFYFDSILVELERNETCSARHCYMPRHLHVHLYGVTDNPYAPQREMEITWHFTKDCNYVPTMQKGHYIGPLILVRRNRVVGLLLLLLSSCEACRLYAHTGVILRCGPFWFGFRLVLRHESVNPRWPFATLSDNTNPPLPKPTSTFHDLHVAELEREREAEREKDESKELFKWKGVGESFPDHLGETAADEGRKVLVVGSFLDRNGSKNPRFGSLWTHRTDMVQVLLHKELIAYYYLIYNTPIHLICISNTTCVP